MRKTRVVLLFAIVVLSCQLTPMHLKAQTPSISYSYDAAGNRIARTTVILRKGFDTTETTTKVAENEVKLFPNPTQGMLKMTISNLTKDSKGNIKVVDLKGEQVFYLEKISEEFVVDLSKCVNGVYLLNLELNGKITTWKIIKNL